MIGSKIFGFLVVFVLTTSVSAQVQPGMKADAFKKAMPDVIPNKVYFNEDLSKTENLAGFKGNWYLDFNHDSLKSVYYSQNLGLRPFKGLHTSFDSLVKIYTLKMGEPAWKKMNADTSLTENRKRQQNVDTIRAVCWKTRFADVVLGLYYTGNYKVKMSPQEKAAQNTVNAEGPINYYQMNVHVQKADHPGDAFSWDIYPGLHVHRVVEVRPQYFPNGIGINGQWSHKQTLFGLEGDRSYQFQGSTLKWMLWNHYAGKHDKATFEKCLKATQAIIADYTQQYGTPVIVEGEKKYRDPYKKLHYGYDVIRAAWDMKTYTIEVQYTFMGGKGQYDLLVRVEERLK